MPDKTVKVVRIFHNPDWGLRSHCNRDIFKRVFLSKNFKKARVALAKEFGDVLERTRYLVDGRVVVRLRFAGHWTALITTCDLPK